MKKLTLLFFGCLFLFACQSNDAKQEKTRDTVPYPDGSYYADADYFNPNTGYKSVYKVSVDIKGMEVYLVHFSGGRVIGEPTFRPAPVTDRRVEFVTDRGVQFNIRNIRSESWSYIDPEPKDLFENAKRTVSSLGLSN